MFKFALLKGSTVPHVPKMTEFDCRADDGMTVEQMTEFDGHFWSVSLFETETETETAIFPEKTIFPENGNGNGQIWPHFVFLCFLEAVGD